MNNVLSALAVATIAMLGSAPTARADDASSPRVVVEIARLRNANGVVRCTIYASPEGFPTKPERALQATRAASIANHRATCIFTDVKPGTYAVSFLHDENANGKMDTNFFGIPTEGYGASNNARGSMGPPKWEAAKFQHGGQTTLRLSTVY